MEAFLVHPASDTSMETNWGKMFALSLVLHLAIFSTFFFFPNAMPTRRIQGTVYEVNLVESPKGKQGLASKSKVLSGKKLSSPAKAASTKRLNSQTSKEKAVVLAKRTVSPKNTKRLMGPEKSKEKSVEPIKRTLKPPEAKRLEPQDSNQSAHVDEALERIKQKVEEQKNAGDEAMSQMNGASGSESVGKGGYGTGKIGLAIHFYQMEVEEKIKSNWSYPVALLGPNRNKNLVTVIELQVKNSGTILRTKVTRRSGDAQFDQSVLKAIKRSDPLPPFPESYKKAYDEIEINFNLSDLI